MTTHVIYHGNCYDGFGAAYAAWKALGASVNYIPALHGDPVPTITEPEKAEVVIVDFSYPRAIMEDLRSKVKSLTVLDHHKTAQKDLEGLSYAKFDMTKSGAVLSWEYFFPNTPVPMFISYLSDRDLWKFEMVGSREISAALRSYPFDFMVWDELSSQQGGCERLAREGKIVLKHQDQMVSIMAGNTVFREVGGFKVPVVNATCYFSEVGDELCKRFPEAPFAAYYFDRGDGKRQWGLRSTKKDVDVSAIAKMYGGGGHPGAAGFVDSLAWMVPYKRAEVKGS